MRYNILYGEKTEIAEFEAINKGYRNDITVVINEKKYKLYITDMIRLHQDFDSETEDEGTFQNEPNMIIVKEVSNEEIEKTIEELFNQGFFDKLGYSF